MSNARAGQREASASGLGFRACRPLVSCEHGGFRVPADRESLFRGREELLQSHRGWDRGALELANGIARRLQAPLFAAEITRLLVDLNRSVNHPEVFSELTRDLPAEERELLLARHYFPFRNGVETAVAAAVAEGATVVHLSVHTFTPEWEGRPRQVDVGLLFDPERGPEAVFCQLLRAEIEARLTTLRVRDNQPYLGVADGFTSYLRQRFPATSYLGVEIEVSGGLVDEGGAGWNALRSRLADAAANALKRLSQAGAQPQ